MKNWYFKHLLSNDPKIITNNSVKIRKFINPMLRVNAKILNDLIGPYKLIKERVAEIPKDKPVIFAQTHGFRDDLLFTNFMTNSHSYILFGNLPEFFNSFNGVKVWLTGPILVDRFEKNSRNSSIPKMKRVIDFGSNVLICPEARWNHSPNVIVTKLFSGVYTLAKETGSLVMPIGYHLDENSNLNQKPCYGILEEAFDITKYSEKEGLEILREKLATIKWELMEKYSTYKREEIDHGQDLNHEWDNYIESLINQTKWFNKEEEAKAYYKPKNEKDYQEVLPITLKKVPLRINNFNK